MLQLIPQEIQFVADYPFVWKIGQCTHTHTHTHTRFPSSIQMT
jgi:hypothetical protein